MRRIGAFAKDPDETLDYSIDWSATLGADTISSSTWQVPSGITQTTPAPSNTTTTTTIWISGGTTGTRYILTNRIVTAAGRTIEGSIQITVEPA